MIPILYLSHYRSTIGGNEKQLYYLVTHLDKDKFQPIVICLNDGTYVHQLRKAGISTVILKLPPWRKVLSYPARYIAVFKLTNLAKKYKIKIIHSSDAWLNPYARRMKKHLLDIPVISHVPNLLTPEQVAKYDFEYMNRIIAISEQSKAPIVKAGISSQKIDVIINCVDLSEFTPLSQKKVLRTDKFVVGLVGRIEPFKRQDTFVEIANLVNRQCQNVEFQIIGAALDTPKHRTFAKQVRELVTKYNLNDRIHFTGHRDDIPKVMQELDLLVTLSAGSVIAEAMASGLPVFGTSIGSTEEMIIDGVTGYIFTTDKIDDISEKIIQLAKYPELCVQMGNAARNHAESTFGIDRHVQKIQDIYMEFLNKH